MPKANPKPLSDEIPSGPVPLDLTNPDIVETQAILPPIGDEEEANNVFFEDEQEPDDDSDDDDDYDTDDDGDDSESEDESEPEVEVAPPKTPCLLCYDSLNPKHVEAPGVARRRYYLNALKGKPEWSYDREQGFVFDSLDHLKLAGSNCKKWGYYTIQTEAL